MGERRYDAHARRKTLPTKFGCSKLCRTTLRLTESLFERAIKALQARTNLTRTLHSIFTFTITAIVFQQYS